MALNPPPALKTLTKNERQEKEQLTAVTHWFHSRGRRDAEGTPIYMKKKKREPNHHVFIKTLPAAAALGSNTSPAEAPSASAQLALILRLTKH